MFFILSKKLFALDIFNFAFHSTLARFDWTNKSVIIYDVTNWLA